MKRLFTALIILATLGMAIWGVSKPWREKKQWEKLVEKASDSIPTSRTIRILGDDWLGYLVVRSGDFHNRMAREGIRVEFQMEPDFDRRFKALRDGSAQFVVATLDSYLVNGASSGWPGAIIFAIDESFGGDAVIGNASIKNIDDLNQPGISGAFVGESPSEFLLKAETAHFRLDKLRPRIPSMRVSSEDDAFSAFKNGRAQFAVLWEPFVGRALKEIPGAHMIIDTRHAQGIVIDIAVASRRVLADDPRLAETFTRCYFGTLHELLNNPDTLKAVAAKDSGKSLAEAEVMLSGIRLIDLDENSTDWMSTAAAPKMADATDAVATILADSGQPPDIPNGDPYSLFFRQTIGDVSRDSAGIEPIIAKTRKSGGVYKPLTADEWKSLAAKVRGTLLDEPITFRPGSSEIPDEFQDEVRSAIPKLSHYPTYRIVVEAHVSPSDDPAADTALSEERAVAVKHFLMWECGVPEERIFTIGAGGASPPEMEPGESQSAWERSARRAKIVLVGDD